MEYFLVLLIATGASCAAAILAKLALALSSALSGVGAMLLPFSPVIQLIAALVAGWIVYRRARRLPRAA